MKVIFEGRVQGVGMRFYIQRVARRYGLRGWVRNLPDGTVEAVIAGPEQVLYQAIEEMKKGSPAANVTNTHIMPYEQPIAATDFEIRY